MSKFAPVLGFGFEKHMQKFPNMFAIRRRVLS